MRPFRTFSLVVLSLFLLSACGAVPGTPVTKTPTAKTPKIHDFLSGSIPITSALSSDLPGVTKGTPLFDSVDALGTVVWAASHPTLPESGGTAEPTVWQTRNGGLSWSTWTPKVDGRPASAIFLALHFVTSSKGFALAGWDCTLPAYGDISCTGATLLATSDGGHSFSTRTLTITVTGPPASATLPPVVLAHSASLSFPSPQVGYALEGGFVFQTTDGGSTWSSLSLGDAAGLPTGMAWTSPTTGLVTTENCSSTTGRVCSLTVLKTTDGGKSFQTVDQIDSMIEGTGGVALDGPEAALTYVSAPNPPPSGCVEDCVPSANATVVLSTDQGGTWSVAQTVLVNSLTWFGPATFQDASHLLIPGGNAGAEIAATGGGLMEGSGIGGSQVSWTTLQPSWAVGPVSSTSSSGWTVGAGGQFLAKSGPPGTPLVRVSHGQPPSTSMAMVTRQKGYGVSIDTMDNRATLLATGNGGTTWRVVNSIRDLWAVSFFAPGQGWVGLSSATEKTTDGGLTFSPPAPLPQGSDAFTLHAFDAKTAIVSGNPPNQIWRTSDGGQTWTVGSLPFPASDYPMVSWANLSDGWALVWHRDLTTTKGSLALEVTHDGGKTFKILWHLPGLLAADRAVDLVTPTDGWVFLDPADPAKLGSFFPRLLHTTDGGKTWTEVRFPETSDVTPNSLDFTSGGVGWLLTIQGGLFRTTDNGVAWTHLP